jgi:hypothetical protein
MSYKVIRATSQQELEAAVITAMIDGWLPTGGVQIQVFSLPVYHTEYGGFFQAMFKTK